MGRLRRLLPRAAAALLALALLFAGWVWAGLPARADVRRLAKERPKTTGVMQQREAEAKAKGRKPRKEQRWVPLSAVSKHLIHAVVTAEDDTFFGHAGFNWDQVKLSIEKNLEKGRFARGGSTISQQLVKNLFFTTRKDPVRKLRELIVTRWLEEDLSKARILELYLNVIEWGDGVYGCEAAARRYFGKGAAELDVQEAAALAAMIPNPRRINPRVNPKRHASATKRVLRLMSRAGYVKRDAAGLGTEPEPEPELVDDASELPEEPEPSPEPAPVPTPSAPAVEPTPVG
ncbi:MAG: monofunctional biosynthetic peptidoglycan transglycosylase [Vicinamibacteria bacterium]|nr:monofunctional biosynthetic peptidoglycan transglycosylase [Vicinamibacteria bacterium]